MGNFNTMTEFLALVIDESRMQMKKLCLEDKVKAQRRLKDFMSARTTLMSLFYCYEDYLKTGEIQLPIEKYKKTGE